MLAQQIYCRLRDNCRFDKDARTRRAVAATVLGQRELELLAFRLSSTHLRLIALRDGGAELARRVGISIAGRRNSKARFEPARVTEIRDQWHLDSSVRRLLRQAGDDPDDPLAEGSNLPDLLGLRLTGRRTCAAIRGALPRLARRDLLECLAIGQLEPANGPLEAMPDAAAAALALPDLQGRSDATVAGRRAVIALAANRLTSPQIADLLGVHRGTVARLRRDPAPVELVRAVELQLGLRRTRQRWP